MKSQPPKSFQIITIDQTTNDGTWCLIKCIRKTSHTEHAASLEWYLLPTVLSWNNEELMDLPLSIQEQSKNKIDELKLEIERLEGEVMGSKQVFDTYRERARISLQKTASEQQEVEKMLHTAKDECKAQSKRTEELLRQIGRLETEHNLVVENMKSQLEKERESSQQLKSEINAVKSELNEAHLNRKDNSSSMSVEVGKLEEELKSVKRACTDLEDMNDNLKRKEQKLLQEQKKKSEAARQLVEMKDKEIEKLKQQLIDSSSSSSSSSSSGSSSSINSLTAAASVSTEPMASKTEIAPPTPVNLSTRYLGYYFLLFYFYNNVKKFIITIKLKRTVWIKRRKCSR